MKQAIGIVPWDRSAPEPELLAPYLGAWADQVKAFHQGIEGYAPTPLHQLHALSDYLGLGAIYVKDESQRFQLNAFKSLGGSWAVCRLVAQRLGIPLEQMSWQKLKSPQVQRQLQGISLVTTTDGNHGRGVAWVAQQLGLPAVVFMPEGTVPERLAHIRRLGAQASILPMNYDDSRRHAEQYAQQVGGLLVQDTAWDDYREIPEWIMQGYVTIAGEINDQLAAMGQQAPTHVFLQCGAGSFAAALAACFNQGGQRPFTAILEPDGANCFYLTAQAKDGQLHAVTGKLDSIMAGLCVGEPSTLAWEMLTSLSDAFVSCPDEVTRLGMRMLGAPLAGDPRIISGESGAVGLGLVAAACLPGGEAVKQALKLDSSARVLLISTEGDTDTAGYRSVVWCLPQH